MKIVVIGHTGFIGKNIYNVIESADKYDLLGISSKEIDLTKENSHISLSKEFSNDSIVIMCAGVKKQLGDNLDIFSSNIEIIKNFCKAILKNTPQKIIYFSSASVYGEDVTYHEKITEKTPVKLRTYYGLSKYTAECLVGKVLIDPLRQLVVLRPPLVYGKDDLSRGYGPTGFTYKAIKNEEITLWGDGSESREFIFVDDISKIVIQLIKKEYCGPLNLVSGTSYTYKDVLNNLKKITGGKIRIVSHERSKPKVDHYYSNQLINNVLGGFKFTDLGDGLRKMYESIINQIKVV